MGAKPTTIGGGSARGVSDNISGLLNDYLGGRQQGAMDNVGRSNPVGQTMDIRGALNALLSGGQGMANGAQAIAANRREENVANIRSRYALGGTGYGTPAAVGEARFLGEFDPQVATQVGGMQLDSMAKGLGFLFPMLQQAYGIGTPQAQTVMKKGFLGNALDTIGGLAGAAAPFFGGGFGGGGADAAAAQSQGQLGQASMFHFPGMSGNEGQGDYWSGFGIGRDSVGTPFDPWAGASESGGFMGGGQPQRNPWSFNLGGVR